MDPNKLEALIDELRILRPDLDDETFAWMRQSAAYERQGIEEQRQAWDAFLASFPAEVKGDIISPVWRPPPGAHHASFSAQQIEEALPRYRGYSMKFIGVPVEGARPDAKGVYPWPAYTNVSPTTGEVTFVMRCWRITVEQEGNPLSLVQLWRPGVEPKIIILGLEQPHRQPHQRQIWRGIGMLRKLAKGRRPGTGQYTPEGFLALVGEPVRTLRQRHHKNPTAAEVMRQLRTRIGRMDKGQFTRSHQALGWPIWDDVLKALDELPINDN